MRDGVFDPNAVSGQIGAMALLRRLIDLEGVNVPAEDDVPLPDAPPPPSDADLAQGSPIRASSCGSTIPIRPSSCCCSGGSISSAAGPRSTPRARPCRSTWMATSGSSRPRRSSCSRRARSTATASRCRSTARSGAPPGPLCSAMRAVAPPHAFGSPQAICCAGRRDRDKRGAAARARGSARLQPGTAGRPVPARRRHRSDHGQLSRGARASSCGASTMRRGDWALASPVPRTAGVHDMWQKAGRAGFRRIAHDAADRGSEPGAAGPRVLHRYRRGARARGPGRGPQRATTCRRSKATPTNSAAARASASSRARDPCARRPSASSSSTHGSRYSRTSTR